MDERTRIAELECLTAEAMQVDAAWANHVLGGAKKRLDAGKPADDLLHAVEKRLQASVGICRQRRAALPLPEYDEALPITAHRREILDAIDANPIVIVAGETGSGKTTQLPKLCLEAGRGTRGLVGCTQPRRIAARAMAQRVSEELRTPLGTTVGYQVRFRENLSETGLVKFMTDGILLAETRQDRDLLAYDTLIIDEAHERSLNIDFLLGYLKNLVSRRPDLRLIVTSATIDTERFSEHFNDAPVIEVSGRGYPVDVVYRPLAGDETRSKADRDMYRGIADAVSWVGGKDPRGDILVFLSGEREIREAGEYLGRQGLRHSEILPLYSRLSSADQQRVFHPGAARRIILSTNVAETSLTVPRIRFVIDTGLVRISRYAHHSRIQRLPIEPVSQASANQRAGRCGRLGPGICVRLFSEEDFDQRPEFTEPEILRTSLASVILRMMTMNLGSIEDFPFIDPPAPRMINDAYRLLFELDALDGDRQVTGTGFRLARWPLDVRLARMILEGDRLGCLDAILVLAAGLSIQDPRERPLDAQQAADELHGRFSDPKSDFVAMVRMWEYLVEQRRERSANAFRKLCRNEFLSWQRVLEWFDLVNQLRDQAQEEGLDLKGNSMDYEPLHQALLSGLLGNIGQRHPEKPVFTGVRNRQFSIFPGSGLAGKSPAWIMSAEVVETSKPYARTNAVIQPEWVEQQGAHLLRRHHFDPHWSRKRNRVSGWEQVSLHGLVLVERRAVAWSGVNGAEAREIFIRDALVTGDMNRPPRFVEHNRRQMAAIEAIEHKRRSHDVLRDRRAIAATLSPLIPAEVSGPASLDRWLKQAGPAQQEALKLSVPDLLVDDAGLAPQALYPDGLRAGGREHRLRYRFEPGADDDGITVVVELEWLNTLDPGLAEWLIPAWLEEKVEALIRSLPKPKRRSLTPTGAFANRAMNALPKKADGSLCAALAGVLSGMTGMDLGEQDFDQDQLPVHLRFRFEICGRDGETVAAGRDLGALQERFGKRARRRFMDREGGDWNQDGQRDWTFGDLPLQVRTGSGTLAYPALVDQQEAVGSRLFDTPGEAAWAHLNGVRRLLAIALKDKMNWFHRNHGIPPDLLAAWSTRGSVPTMLEDLAFSALGGLSDPRALATRDAAAYQALSGEIRRTLGTGFVSHADSMRRILEWLRVLGPAVGGLEGRHPQAFSDLTSVIDDLLYEGFLAEMPAHRLELIPRYLETASRRIDRLNADPGRDRRLAEQFSGYWQRYPDWLDDGNDYDEALDDYRWMCHEYHVSVFAQELGTACKVSPKRLDQAWSAVTAGA